METTAKKKTPFYQIIIDDILAQIAAGSFSYDQPICTENSLIEQYGFSRITVRRAMTELENRGILYRKRGVGSFVCHPEELAPALPETSSSPAGKLFACIQNWSDRCIPSCKRLFIIKGMLFFYLYCG